MSWLDYADCAGDDPRKWDADWLVATEDFPEVAAAVACADCPVRRECALDALEGIPLSAHNRLMLEWNASFGDSPGRSIRPIEAEMVGETHGVVRAGVLINEWPECVGGVCECPACTVVPVVR